MSEAMISLTRVSKHFGTSSVPAVHDLSFDVREGELVVLVGPSGCGKTTTMKMINRLIEPSAGEIFVDGENVLEQDAISLRRRIGYVIQSVGLLPHRTIAQNIATVPRLLGWERKRVERRVDELLEMFELDRELLQRYPSELSGGQQQRVGVARALAADPPVMLMDEPFGAVDPIVRDRLQDQFLGLQRHLRKTIVFVTHDIDEAVKLADRIAIMNMGGVLEQYASPEEILRQPANDFVRRFVGAERGLKRLSLRRVRDIEVEEAPVVEPGAPSADAIELMDKFDEDWATVVSDGRLLGWVDRDSLTAASVVGDVETRRFSAHITADNSLREALDAIVTSATNVAVVVDEGERYLGVLTLGRLSQEIVR